MSDSEIIEICSYAAEKLSLCIDQDDGNEQTPNIAERLDNEWFQRKRRRSESSM